jgi:hypothetical protein
MCVQQPQEFAEVGRQRGVGHRRSAFGPRWRGDARRPSELTSMRDRVQTQTAERQKTRSGRPTLETRRNRFERTSHSSYAVIFGHATVTRPRRPVDQSPSCAKTRPIGLRDLAVVELEHAAEPARHVTGPGRSTLSWPKRARGAAPVQGVRAWGCRRPPDRAEVPEAQASSESVDTPIFRRSVLGRVFAPAGGGEDYEIPRKAEGVRS